MVKIRKGFVSNSSSSSFIIVDVKYRKKEELLAAAEIPYDENANCDYGSTYDGYLTVIYPEYTEKCTCKKCKDEADDDCNNQIVESGMSVGYEITNLDYALKDKTLTQLKEEIVEEVKKRYGIDLTVEDLSVEVGEYEC